MKRIYWILLIIVAVLAVGWYWMQNQPVASSGEAANESSVSYDVDLTILDSPAFERLKIFSDLPVQKGETGNEHPVAY